MKTSAISKTLKIFAVLSVALLMLTLATSCEGLGLFEGNGSSDEPETLENGDQIISSSQINTPSGSGSSSEIHVQIGADGSAIVPSETFPDGFIVIGTAEANGPAISLPSGGAISLTPPSLSAYLTRDRGVVLIRTVLSNTGMLRKEYLDKENRIVLVRPLDENGVLCGAEELDENGNVIARSEVTLHKNGLIETESFYDLDGVLIRVDTYNSRGNWDSTRYYDSNGEVIRSEGNSTVTTPIETIPAERK